MLCLVVVFGIHSLVDWTWYVPGDACVALLCAGWLAGRGPLEPVTADGRPLEPVGAADADGQAATLPAGAPGLEDSDGLSSGEDDGRSRPRSLRELNPLSAGIACAVIVASLLAAWVQWVPQSSENASQEALSLLASNPSRATAAARTAVARDPLSVQALFSLSTVQQATGETALARATLQHAVHLQPSNPETWLRLGQYDLAGERSGVAISAAEGGAHVVVTELGAAIYLNPESIAPEAVADGNPEAISIQNDYVEALRASSR